ncbi:MAG: glycosyltransferase [Gammaproteobacteria bacterium]
MKLLHITPSHYPATCYGGPIFSTMLMNNRLAKIPNVSLRVLTTDAAGPRRLSNDERREAQRFGYPVVFSRRWNGDSVAPGLVVRLWGEIRRSDVVHLTATYSFPTLPTLLLCRLLNKPLVWSLRGALLDDLNRHQYDPQRGYWRAIKHLWLAGCRHLADRDGMAIHVTTEQERDVSRRMFPQASFAVIPNGVDLPETIPVDRSWMPGGQLRLIYLGRLAPKKGVENLLRAVARLESSVHLKIYGTGHKEYVEGLRALARDLGLEKRALFLGHVDGEDKSRAFFEADVCLVPSYSENFCIVVAEALAHGLPVIVSDRLSWGEVADKMCGLVVPNDPESLAEAVARLSGRNLEAMGRLGRQWMESNYSWNKVALRFYRLYDGLATGGNLEKVRGI